MNGSNPSLNTASNPPSINGSKTAIFPELTFNENGKFKSSMGRVATVLAVLFFITTIIFVILFAVYYTRYDDEVSKADSDAVIGTDQVCTTPNCILAAATMIKKMNLSVDPCDDFSEYACGRFIKESVLPEGKTRIGTFSVLSDENNLIMKDIITEAIDLNQAMYLTNMKRLYRSCINEAQIENIGLEPYKNSEFAKEWPTLNQNWTGSNFSVNDLIARYEAVYIEPLFGYSASLDMKDSSKKALYITEPSLGLSQEYFNRPRNNSVILAYEKYLAETAVALGANQTVAENDAREVVDLEIAISSKMWPREEKRDSSKQYNPVTFANLSSMYPEIDIPRAIREAFMTVNITLSDDQIVINRYPSFIGNLSSIIASTPNRTLQNLFGFKFALSRVASLTRKMREIRLEFDKVYLGSMAENPRWETCLGSTANTFWRGMARKFVDRTFSQNAKKYMEEMIDNLKAEFRKMVQESTWMGESTKTEAYKKLAAIRRKIGYPDADFEEADIEKKYAEYVLDENHYYNNRVLTNKLSNLEGIKYLREPVDKNEWHMAPYEVNAYYSGSLNEIAFPAGILQSPFFSESFQDSMNYGAIGVVIGHEITHGFDDQGSQYDAEGNLRNWWQESDRKNFVDRKQCIINQNSNFHLMEIHMNLNGVNLQGESVADNGGVKESYRAYRELVRKSGEHPTLPGLGLTQDQLFFLGYGQLWCEKMTKERLISQVTTGVHPPGKYRIIGPLQNSEDFASAYNCRKGSYMNPDKKCSVW